MNIIDNFLPERVFRPIQSMFESDTFSWYWNNHKSTYDDPMCSELEDYQFTHTFYLNHTKRSQYNIDPIINQLKPNALVRIKANLTTRTSEIVKYGFHIDTNIHCKTAIYYINSNDGYTEFMDGNKVNSIENRMVIFDSKLGHTGTSCTDSKRRIVVNFNYF